MSWDKEIKNHIVSILSPRDHKHLEMTEAIQCKSCGKRMVKAQSEYHRLRMQHPEKFVQQSIETYSKEEENMKDMLAERLKNDIMYREHVKKMAVGTIEEKKEEAEKINNNFYENQSGYKDKKNR